MGHLHETKHITMKFDTSVWKADFSEIIKRLAVTNVKNISILFEDTKAEQGLIEEDLETVWQDLAKIDFSSNTLSVAVVSLGSMNILFAIAVIVFICFFCKRGCLTTCMRCCSCASCGDGPSARKNDMGDA